MVEEGQLHQQRLAPGRVQQDLARAGRPAGEDRHRAIALGGGEPAGEDRGVGRREGAVGPLARAALQGARVDEDRRGGRREVARQLVAARDVPVEVDQHPEQLHRHAGGDDAAGERGQRPAPPELLQQRDGGQHHEG